MSELDAKKKQEIKRMVAILEQIDLPGILVLSRDANTLLIRQQEAEKQMEKAVYMDYRIRCPHCGRFGDFHVCTPEELQEEKEM